MKKSYILYLLFILFPHCRLELNNLNDPSNKYYYLNLALRSGAFAGSTVADESNLTVSYSPSSKSVVYYSSLVTLSPPDTSYTILYTTDGSSPSLSSSVYVSPLQPLKQFLGYPIRAILSKNGKLVGKESIASYYYPIPKTEQTSCYNNSASVIPCTSTEVGQDGYEQRGVSQSFTGPTQHATYTTDYTTTDLLTSLVWTSCLQGQTGVTCSGTATLGIYSAANTYCSSLNSSNAGAGYAGITNWRLPTAIEMNSLLQNKSNVATSNISATNFPNNSSNYDFTSTPDPLNSGTKVYQVGFINQILNSAFTSSSLGTRCVSGPSTPLPSLSDKGDGSLFDKNSGMYYTKCLNGETLPNCSGSPVAHTWSSAVSYCQGLSIGSRTWRLANITELIYINGFTATSNPYVASASLFTPNLSSKTIFSSTMFVNASYPDTVVVLDTATGSTNNAISRGASNYSICVSGP